MRFAPAPSPINQGKRQDLTPSPQSLAFALGATDLARDLIGAQGLQQHCELHQRVRIDDIEGEVVDLTATSVVLATSEGRVVVP